MKPDLAKTVPRAEAAEAVDLGPAEVVAAELAEAETAAEIAVATGADAKVAAADAVATAAAAVAADAGRFQVSSCEALKLRADPPGSPFCFQRLPVGRSLCPRFAPALFGR